MALPGGYSAEDIAKGQELATAHKADIEAKAGKTFTTFVVEGAEKQVVAGLNHKLKIKVDGDKHIAVVIHVPLQHTGKPAEVTSVADA